MKALSSSSHRNPVCMGSRHRVSIYLITDAMLSHTVEERTACKLHVLLLALYMDLGLASCCASRFQVDAVHFEAVTGVEAVTTAA